MDPRVKKFIEESTIASFKSALTKLNLRTTGNKPELKLRFEEGINGKNTDEILEIISHVSDDDLEDDDETTTTTPTDQVRNNNVILESNRLSQEIEELEAIIEKKKKVAELKKKLMELEQSEETLSSNHTCIANYRDIEESLYKFSGDDNFTIQKWMQQFEETSIIYKWDDNMKIIYAKKSMIGTAKLFLRAKPVKTWAEFKYSLLKEFKKATSTAEIHTMLRNRRKKVSETYQQYVLAMEEIGSLSDVAESDILQYIIDGIQDAASNKALLYTANSVEELKYILKKYEKMKNHSSNYVRSTPPLMQQMKTKERYDDYRNIQQHVVKCYNCNQSGHVSKLCPKPKREFDSCFRCGKVGHRIRDCPVKPSVNNLLSKSEALPTTNTYGKNNDFQYFLDFEFFSEHQQQHFITTLSTLVDSGSPISFIQERFVTSYEYEQIKPEHHEYYGINNSPLKTVGIVNCRINFKGDFIDICLYVVRNYSMSYNVILGRDFLKLNKLTLTKSDKIDKNFDNNVQHDEKETESNNDDIRYSDDGNFVSEILNIDIVDLNLNCALKINPDLPEKVKLMINDILSESFPYDTNPSVLHNSDVKLSIQLTRSDPFSCPPRRLPFSHKEELKKILDELLKKNIIRESNSPYASPIVLVQKKNKELRLCVDYRQLNKHTVKDNYPLPLIDDLLDGLKNKKYFTVLDLKNGFHHVDVAEDSVKFTSFVTPLGQFEYLKMPFGLKNAPCVFQRYINRIFQDLLKENKIRIYMDDILLATDSIDEHIKILKSVLKLMKIHKLELRLDKCSFLEEEIKYLGYIVSVKGIRPNTENLKVIRNYPVPQNVKQVQSFIGLCSYFRRFVENFAIIAKPLYDLIKKDAPFKFASEELNAFETLKQKLLEAPTLCVYSPFNKTELHCDASNIGFGAILMQKQEDGKFHPIFYFSRRCTDVETRYHSFELETLSIVYALRRFRVYLIGVEFKIVTDCRSLTLTLDKKLLNPRISRWALEMQDFNYTVEHRSSDRMKHVDCLSRCTNILTIESETFEFTLAVAQKRDPVIRELSLQLEKSESQMFALINGLVYRKYKDEVMFYVPKQLESYVIQTHHEALCHVGVDKCFEYMRRIYWFPEMKNKIKIYIKNCLKCIQFSAPSGKTEGVLHSIPKGKKPFETFHVDHLGPLPNTKTRKKHIFLIIDGFTKFIKLYSVNSTQSSEAIKCLESCFSSYSRPSRIISDRGSCFTSKEFLDFLQDNNIQHVKVATMSPQSNGQIERINRVIIPMLAKECESDTTGDWYKFLTKAEYALNNTINRSTGQTPSILLFGVKQKGAMCDKLMERLEEDYTKEEERDLVIERGKASEKIKHNQKINENHFNNKHKKPHRYDIGDYVMIRNVVTTAGVNKKFLPKYKGPYEVIKVYDNDRYMIQDIEGMQVSRIHYEGVCTPANMKLYSFGT